MLKTLVLLYATTVKDLLLNEKNSKHAGNLQKATTYLIDRNCNESKKSEVTNFIFVKNAINDTRNLMSRTIKFLNVARIKCWGEQKFLNAAGINCCESKQNQKVPLHDLDLKGSYE